MSARYNKSTTYIGGLVLLISSEPWHNEWEKRKHDGVQNMLCQSDFVYMCKHLNSLQSNTQQTSGRGLVLLLLLHDALLIILINPKKIFQLFVTEVSNYTIYENCLYLDYLVLINTLFEHLICMDAISLTVQQPMKHFVLHHIL